MQIADSTPMRSEARTSQFQQSHVAHPGSKTDIKQASNKGHTTEARPQWMVNTQARQVRCSSAAKSRQRKRYYCQGGGLEARGDNLAKHAAEKTRRPRGFCGKLNLLQQLRAVALGPRTQLTECTRSVPWHEAERR